MTLYYVFTDFVQNQELHIICFIIMKYKESHLCINEETTFISVHLKLIYGQ